VVSIYSLKPRFQAALRPAQHRLVGWGVSADQLTGAGLALSGLVGLVFVASGSHPALLWAIPGLLLGRMALNALDGLVARQTSTASESGRVFNEMADVGGDAVAYLPLAVLLPGHAVWIAVVVCGGLLSEFASVVAGEPRRNQGPLGKSDRAAVFSVFAIALAIAGQAGTWITWSLAILTVGTALTIRNRTRHA